MTDTNGNKFTIPYPALAIIIPLLISLLINLGVMIRWGTSLEKQLESSQDKIKILEGQLDIERTWRENTRERLLKLEMDRDRDRERSRGNVK